MSKFFHLFKSNSRSVLLAAISGVLIGTSYIPFPAWALLFCYVPLFLLLQKETSLKKVFIFSWLTQFILTLIGFNWIYYVSSEFGLLHWSLSLAALLLFASFMHIYIPLAMLIAKKIQQAFKIEQDWAQLALFALCLGLIERVWPSIFEWNLAYSFLWMKWPIYQWADTVGFWGLSTWLYLFQAAITYAVLNRKTLPKKSLLTITSSVFLFLLLNGLGLLKEKKWSRFNDVVHFSVAQGNIGNAEKLQSEKGDQFHSSVLNTYAELTEQNFKENPNSEIMLWPETALPFPLDPFFLKRKEQSELLQLIKKWNRPLVTGSYSADLTQRDHLGNILISNSVFFMGPQDTALAPAYNKTDLLVFGEYMPLGQQFPFLYKLLPFVGVYKRGPGPSPTEVLLSPNKKITLGPQICYESLNPGFSRGLANKGAEILFNVTNDSWFGWWAEPFQHQYMTLGRAIEVRRPLVRSTNTGITTVVLANGEVLESSPVNQKWQHTYPVKFQRNSTLSAYTRWGHLDAWFWLIVLIFLVYRFRKSKDSHVLH